jgi:hypothetical protein
MLNKQHLYGTIRNEERVFTDAYENKKLAGCVASRVCHLAVRFYVTSSSDTMISKDVLTASRTMSTGIGLPELFLINFWINSFS